MLVSQPPDQQQQAITHLYFKSIQGHLSPAVYTLARAKHACIMFP